MTDDLVEVLDERARWRARDVSYCAGRWDQVRKQIPQFETAAFRASKDSPGNPYMMSVIRLPRSKFEQPIPVGTVSNTYTLAQHLEVAEKCFEGIRKAGVETGRLRCELGLSELGEWMNLRIYFPDDYSHRQKDGQKLGLRLECFNSVDGSSRLVMFLGWLRFVCSNGMVIGETKTEFRDIHNKSMNLEKIPEVVSRGLALVQQDLDRLPSWEHQAVTVDQIKPWANKILSREWGKKAACRVFHICSAGYDVEIENPFAPGEATEKPVKRSTKVPGVPIPANNLYDMSQALSWVASNRRNPDERIRWQSAIPALINAMVVIA